MPSIGIDDFIDLRNRGGIHPNPTFDFLSGYVPKNLKALLIWSEYLVYNSPHIYAAQQKLSEYTVTDIEYNTEDEAVREQHKELFENILQIKSLLKAAARDRGIYGNSFITVFFPFKRTLKCNRRDCGSEFDIKFVDYKFKYNKLQVVWRCDECGSNNTTPLEKIKDTKIANPKKVNIIRWDPKAMEINYNPITGDKEYSYKVPATIREKVKNGSKFLINSMPKEFIKACRGDSLFTFREGKVYHMKVDAPAGVDTAWGMPPLTSTLKQFFYTAMLRKANEATALEHILPFRVLHPGQGSAQGDPTITLSLNRWMEETKLNIKKWRRDPLHVMFSPVPLGVTQMGGNGRSLLTLGELEAAENNIMAAMGIPREFLYGGLSFTGSSVTLRMLENQLESLTKELEGLLNWIGAQCASFLGWEKITYNLVPFKLIDDVQQKSAILSLAQSGEIVSKSSLAQAFGFDLDEERDKRMQETLREIKFQAQLQKKISESEDTLTNAAEQQVGSTPGLNYDQQAVIAQADQIVEQIAPLDYGQRRSFLESLNNEDAVMHAVVVQRLEEQNKMLAAKARSQARQTAGME